jgi:hypothetical protein
MMGTLGSSKLYNRTESQEGHMTLEKGLAAFLDAMLGKNRSSATLRAYKITGCKFSREHILLSLALVEVQNNGRVWCRQKNVR